MVSDGAFTIGDVGAGHVLGRYELLVPIAQGGMAVVWAARMKGMRRFQKVVAIKSLLPMLSMDPTFERMFMSEAELASRIRHPNCCEIMDLGEHDGALYIVMEWIDGDPLFVVRREAKQHGGVPVSVAARIASLVAAGLHAAHELTDEKGELIGLVHRDVSPQNIMVTPHGEVKILDFGVAKATQAADAEHTRAGQIKGKVPFMAPEQALGRAVDRRTDIFSLGIVLYQLVTGKHPFKQKEDLETLRRICDRAPVDAPSAMSDRCPPELEPAIMKALEKDPADRFQTMDEFRRAIDEALGEMSSSGTGHEDLPTFARKVLTARSEKRQKAIQEAMRVADDRAAGRDPGDMRASMPSIPGATSARGSDSGADRLSGSLGSGATASFGHTAVEQSGEREREVTGSLNAALSADFTPTITPPKGVLVEELQPSSQFAPNVSGAGLEAIRFPAPIAPPTITSTDPAGASAGASAGAGVGPASPPRYLPQQDLSLDDLEIPPPPKSDNRGMIVALVVVFLAIVGVIAAVSLSSSGRDAPVPLQQQQR